MAGMIQNQIAKKDPEQKTMQQYIKSMEGEIKKALPVEKMSLSIK